MTIASRSMTSPSSRYRRIGCSGARSSSSSARSAARFSSSAARSVRDPLARVRAAARPRRAARRGSPGSTRRARRPPARGCSRSGSARSMTTSSVSSPKDCPKPSRKSIGTPMTSATSAPFRPFERAREKNSSWSAGTQPRARPLRKTGMPSSCASASSAVLAVAPVEVRAGHDHRALGVAQQRGGARDVGHRARPAASGSGARLVGLGRLGEHDVHREVDEGRARSAA